MAGTVGGIACDFVRGTVASARQEAFTWTVPGIDGQGRQRLGTRPTPSTLTVVFFNSEASVITWYRSIEALQRVGDAVSVTNDHGETATVFINRVSELRLSAAVGAGGTRGECQLSVSGAA